MKGEAVAAEVEEETGEEVLILPTVKISHGSVDVDIDVKGAKWSARLKAKASAAFLAAVLALSPADAGPTIKPDELSINCRSTIEAVVNSTMETWEFHGKGYTAEFEVTCGNSRVTSRLHSPPNPSH